ncbi:MAG: glycosyltransferase [Betaproteobacteria bacterium]|nr:glycosyltransferase [Betaproteobacteria bacterium]
MNQPQRPLRILYHHRTQGRGAEGVHIVSIVHALEKMGHHVMVLSPSGVDPMKAAGDAPVDKSPVKTKGMQRVWSWISRNLPNWLFELAEIAYNVPAGRRLEEVLAASHYDIIYERYAFYLLAGSRKAAKYNIPFVLEANEVSGIKDRARKQNFERLCRRFERSLFSRCAGILTVSSHLRDRILANGVEPARVRVVPNAVDIEKFALVKRDPGLIAQLGLTGSKVMVVAGWFDKWDRLDFLMSALAKLTAPFPDVKLLVVGDGPVLAEARTKAASLGLDKHLVFAGAVPRKAVLGYLCLADIAVLPHSNEFGSPVVMFEFMGLHVPVVAPRLAPIEDVHVDGETALLFAPLKLEELTDKLSALLSSSELRKAVADRAYAQLVREHTWEQNARQILDVAGRA